MSSGRHHQTPDCTTFERSSVQHQASPSSESTALQYLHPSSMTDLIKMLRCTLHLELLGSKPLFLALLLILQLSMAQTKSILSAVDSRVQHHTADPNADTSLSSLTPLHSEDSLVRSKRGTDDPLLWENGRIPFVFKEPFPRKYKIQVMKAIKAWQKKTCITFVDRTNEEYFVRFEINPAGCNSPVGMKRWSVYKNTGQPIFLSIACLRKRGYIMHEIGHAIGLYHEHQRPDRDNYIKVHMENIAPIYRSEFEKYDFEVTTTYDFASIMHYPLNFFAFHNTSSLEVLPNVTNMTTGMNIGLRKSLSKLDSVKVNTLYNCDREKPTEEITTPTVALSGNNIYTGEEVGLLANGTSFTNGSWVSCTEQRCTVNNCPGKHLREDDMTSCPHNFFTLHKLQVNESRIVRVGDAIVLEHKLSLTDQQRSMYVSCNSKTLACSLSSECSTKGNQYNETFCRENILIVRAEGKKTGDAITHRDIIGLEFNPPNNNNDPFIIEQCAFGCNHESNTCSKKVCITLSNSVINSGSGDLPTCGKDMFFVQKI